MKRLESEIAILGGGCAGLWVSYELARLGYSPLLIEHGQLAQYASQRNQGWLHTGSLYAAMMSENPRNDGSELIRLAQSCLRSSNRLKSFAKRHARGSLDLKSQCLYLYSDVDQADLTAERLREIGLEPRIWRHGLGLIEPILSGSPVSVALETPDIPMNCGKLLGAVLRRSQNFGTRVFQSPTALDSLNISRTDDNWIIQSPEFEIASKILITTVGPLIRQMQVCNQIFPNELPALQRGIVAVIDRRVCNRILVFRDKVSSYLNLTPFAGLTTINLGGSDGPATDCSEPMPTGQEIGKIADRLASYCPGLTATPRTVRAHFYQCHKVANNVVGSHPIGRTAPRHYFWRPGGNGLYYLYPGKFTLGLTSAQAFVREIRTSLTFPQKSTTSISHRSSESLISPSPYIDVPTHFLHTDSSGSLQFVRRLM